MTGRAAIVRRPGARDGRRGRRNHFFHAARALAHALAHAVRRHQSARHQRRLGDAKTLRRRHDLAVMPRNGIGVTRSSASVWGAFMWQLEPTLFWWFTPVLAGMVLSIPLSVLTSRRSLGARARQAGSVSYAGRNQAAGGIDFAARTLENSRTHRRLFPAAPARRPGRGHP